MAYGVVSFKVAHNLSLGQRTPVLLMADGVRDSRMVPHFRRWQPIPSNGSRHLSHQVVDAPRTRGTLRISAYGHTLVHCLLYATSQSWSMVLRIVAWRTMICAGISAGTSSGDGIKSDKSMCGLGVAPEARLLGSMSCFAWCNAGMALRCPPVHMHQARLRLGVEEGPPFSVTVYLYEVKKDWNPGGGGIEQ